MPSLNQLILSLALFMMAPLAMGQKTAGETVDDTWIHTKAKGALVGYGSSDINLEVYHGVVQMAGFVRSEARREAAESAVRGLKGVVEVRNRLVVQTAERTAGQMLDDGVIAAGVKGALSDDDRTSAFSINVEVRNGVVLLSGFVKDYGEGQIAEQVARGVSNVRDVINGTDVPPAE